MATTESKADKKTTAGRDSRMVEFVRLKDGRQLVVPPSRGSISKADIRRAVIAVKEARIERK